MCHCAVMGKQPTVALTATIAVKTGQRHTDLGSTLLLLCYIFWQKQT